MIMQNYIFINRNLLPRVENEIVKTAFPRLKLAKVLDFRLRVHKLRGTIRELILGKISVYSSLYARSIPFEPLLDLADRHHAKLTAATKEFAYLLEAGPKNIKLNKEAIMFELCVLERLFVSKRLKKMYSEALIDMRNRTGSVHSFDNNKAKLSFYSSSNIVVFARNVRGSFKIFHFTPNSADLFGVRKNDLAGMSLTEFMPPQIAQMHDRLLINYLNGSTQSRKNGRIFTVVVSKRRVS